MANDAPNPRPPQNEHDSRHVQWRQLTRLAIYATALFAIAIGLLVMLGWYTRSAFLVQVFPRSAPMHYNTALGFLLCGSGLIALLRGRLHISQGCAATVGLLGLLTQIEYAFRVDLGIDQLLMQDYISVAPYNPGRMAPDSALSFVLFAVALAIASMPLRVKRRTLIVGVLGSLIVAFGLVPLFGYLTHVGTASGWGYLTRMATLTATGFAMLGLGIIALAWLDATSQTDDTPRWLPIPVFVGGTTLSLALWQVLQAEPTMAAEAKATLSALSLILGLTMTLLLALTVHLAIGAHNRAAEAESIRDELQREVAVRKKAEMAEASLGLLAKQARESTESLHAMLDAIPESAFLIAPDGLVLAANQTIADRLDTTVDRFAGANYYDFLQPEESVRIRALIDRVLASRKRVRFESTKDHRVTQTSIYPILNDSGDVASLSMLGIDVTRQREAASLIVQNEARLRALIEIAPLGLSIARDDKLLFCNVAYIRMFGYATMDDLTGSSLLEQIATLFRAEVGQIIAGQNAGEEASITFDTVGLRKDGTEFPIAVQFAEIELVDGPAHVAFITDITERKNAEIAMVENEERFRQTFEQAAVGIANVGTDGRFLRLNERLCDITGYTREELATLTIQDITYPDDLDLDDDYVQRMSVREITSYVSEKRYVRRDGDYVWVRSTISAIRQDDGTISHFILVVEDISTQKDAEERLSDVVKELLRSNSDLEQFAYVASHDLQEPLRMIASFTQLLADRYRDRLDEKAEKWINYIVEGTGRMQLLINDLLAYSRIGTKAKPFQETDCGAVIAAVVQDLSQTIEKNQANIVVAPLPTVQADSDQLRLLFQNLIENAIKYRGDDPPCVEITASRTDDTWQFAVQDNGIGIEPQYSERIFVIFQRLHDRSHYSGSGIGLAIAKKIVERHGGRICLAPSSGKGARFEFTLPA